MLCAHTCNALTCAGMRPILNSKHLNRCHVAADAADAWSDTFPEYFRWDYYEPAPPNLSNAAVSLNCVPWMKCHDDGDFVYSFAEMCGYLGVHLVCQIHFA